MKTCIKLLLIISLVLFNVKAFSAEHSELKAFPDAGDGMERLIIELPVMQEEDSFKVELIPGRLMWTDGVNLTRLGVTVSSHPLPGWGYTYYQVAESDVVMSTMMAAPEGGQRVKVFVEGTSLFVRYNSSLPIVVYVPKGYEIRYRIWNAGVSKNAEKG